MTINSVVLFNTYQEISRSIQLFEQSVSHSPLIVVHVYSF